MSTIYAIRHGQASFATDEYDRLSDLGVCQAECLGQYLKARGVTFDQAYTGTLERQRSTARAVLGALGQDLVVRENAAFDEYDTYQVIVGQLSRLAREDPSIGDDLGKILDDPQAYRKVYESAMIKWSEDRAALPDLETWDVFRLRVQGGLERIREECGQGKRVALFTSGGTISAIMQVALKIDDPGVIRLTWQLRNTSVSTFLYNREQISLQSFNSLAHLELLDDPSILTFK